MERAPRGDTAGANIWRTGPGLRLTPRIFGHLSGANHEVGLSGETPEQNLPAGQEEAGNGRTILLRNTLHLCRHMRSYHQCQRVRRKSRFSQRFASNGSANVSTSAVPLSHEYALPSHPRCPLAAHSGIRRLNDRTASS